MKNKLLACSMLLLAGIGFLAFAQFFGATTYRAPNGTTLEAVSCIPAVALAFAGTLCLIGSVTFAAMVLAGKEGES